MAPDAKSDVGSRCRWFPVFPFLAFALTGFALGWRTHTSQTSSLVSQSADLAQWADEQSCSECHEQAQYFWETGHANTLRPAADSFSLEHLRKLNNATSMKSEGTRVKITDKAVTAVHQLDGHDRQVPLTWCFGSGAHACTWTGILPDINGMPDQMEFRWTWYRESNSAAVTPGQSLSLKEDFFGPLGVLHDGPKSRRCLSCHTSYLPPENSKLDVNHMRLGVTCQRCHGPRQAHVASAGAVTNAAWRSSGRMDAVNRCAQCHRRADEQESSTIHPDNPDIVRFQPVGLVQSACFKKSQMSCTTCHNPHLPLSQQDLLGAKQCVQCHDPSQSQHVLCGNGNRDDCICCHMPKVKMEAPLRFTDHWIRVRDGGEQP